MSRRLRLIISAALALLAVVLHVVSLRFEVARAETKRVEAYERYGGEVVELVVATRDMHAGETLTATDVEKKSWVAEFAPEGAYTSRDELVGKTLTSAVASNIPFTSLSFENEFDELDVPEGMVGLSLSISDKVALPAKAQRGSTIAAYSIDDKGSRLITDKIVVLGDLVEKKGLSGTGKLSVAVDAHAVSDVLNAQAKGTLRLVMPGDNAQITQEQSAPTSVDVHKEAESK